MAQMRNTSIYLQGLEDKIDARDPKSRSQFIREGIRMRLELADALDQTDTQADDLPEEWWSDWLYDRARKDLNERWAREATNAISDE